MADPLTLATPDHAAQQVAVDCVMPSRQLLVLLQSYLRGIKRGLVDDDWHRNGNPSLTWRLLLTVARPERQQRRLAPRRAHRARAATIGCSSVGWVAQDRPDTRTTGRSCSAHRAAGADGEDRSGCSAGVLDGGTTAESTTTSAAQQHHCSVAKL